VTTASLCCCWWRITTLIYGYVENPCGPPSVFTTAMRIEPDIYLIPQLLSTFIRKGNYNFCTAENGLEALQAFQVAQRAFDIVFMGKDTF
jgi:hypothetical protein